MHIASTCRSPTVGSNLSFVEPCRNPTRGISEGPTCVPQRHACISNGSSSPQPALDRVFYSLALDTMAQLNPRNEASTSSHVPLVRAHRAVLDCFKSVKTVRCSLIFSRIIPSLQLPNGVSLGQVHGAKSFSQTICWVQTSMRGSDHWEPNEANAR